MSTPTITRKTLTFQVTDELGVIATGPNGEIAHGHLANSGGKVIIYPRIEFAFFKASRWIEPFCDHRYWDLDDYETAEETAKRPLDNGTFDLTAEERAAIQTWYNDTHAPIVTPRPTSKLVAEPVEPIFAIGGLNRGDGAESPTPWPRTGRACRVCGESESLGAMFTTLGGDVTLRSPRPTDHFGSSDYSVKRTGCNWASASRCRASATYAADCSMAMHERPRV